MVVRALRAAIPFSVLSIRILSKQLDRLDRGTCARERMEGQRFYSPDGNFVGVPSAEARETRPEVSSSYFGRGRPFGEGGSTLLIAPPVVSPARPRILSRTLHRRDARPIPRGISLLWSPAPYIRTSQPDVILDRTPFVLPASRFVTTVQFLFLCGCAVANRRICGTFGRLR